jgi:hypothetical protein
MEFYRMAGDVDYMLRVVVPDIAGYDTFYKKLIGTVPLKNVTSRFAMERIKSTTALRSRNARYGTRVTEGRQSWAHVDLVVQRQCSADDIADYRLVGVLHCSRSARCSQR